MADVVRKNLRIAAYGVCVVDERILLARFVGASTPRWTLPGGGLDHGEDPADGVLRELTEETGHTGEVVALLGVHSFHLPRRPWDGEIIDHHGLRVIYEVRLTGGELRDEVGGSTDQAAWFPLSEAPALDRLDLVDIGLRMWRER